MKKKAFYEEKKACFYLAIYINSGGGIEHIALYMIAN